MSPGSQSDMTEQLSMRHTHTHTHTHTHNLYSFIDRHCGCFHILAIINNAVLNMGGCMLSFQIKVFVSFEYIPRNGSSESYGGSMFSYLRNLQDVSHGILWFPTV